MVVCFNCAPETRKELDRLVQLGQHADYGEAISSAVQNALILQEEINKSGSIVLGSDSAEVLQIAEDTEPYRPSVVVESKSAPENQNRKPKRARSSLHIPEIFLFRGNEESPPPLADFPFDMWTKGQEIPLDRWLFGQFNKLLPAKASCRALAFLTSSKSESVPLEEAALIVAKEASILGDFLAQHDKLNGIKRDNALSTAFPTSGKGVEKSQQRYANQFVASINKQDQISGLLFDLKLINRAGRKKKHLLLTEPGWQFASMPNPILDDQQEHPRQKFSQDEKRFLLDHIAQSVPVEDFAYRSILKAILDGADTPKGIDAALQEQVSEGEKSNLSGSFLSSQRSSAISRMEDLGLVERVRNGIHISYAITELGKRYLSDAS